MAQGFHLSIVNEESGEPHDEIVEFTDPEWEQLREFSQYVEQLYESPAVSRMSVKAKFSGEMVKPLAVDSECFPHNDDIAATLLFIRPFVLNDERAYFPKIRKILKRRIGFEAVRNSFDKQQELFSGKAFQSQLKISVDDTVINSEAILMKWLNAYHYHRGLDKQKELGDLLSDLLLGDFSKAIFVYLIIDKIKAILNLDRVIRWLQLRDETTFSFGRREGESHSTLRHIKGQADS